MAGTCMNAPGYGLTDRARVVSISRAVIEIDARRYLFVRKTSAKQPFVPEPRFIEKPGQPPYGEWVLAFWPHMVKTGGSLERFKGWFPSRVMKRGWQAKFGSCLANPRSEPTEWKPLPESHVAPPLRDVREPAGACEQAPGLGGQHRERG